MPSCVASATVTVPVAAGRQRHREPQRRARTLGRAASATDSAGNLGVRDRPRRRRLGQRPAARDGENADPANGRALDGGVLAFTPGARSRTHWAGPAGYERVRRSDEQHEAPGADTLRSLLGDEPALILLDELSVYLRKVSRRDDAGRRLTAFLTSLFKAVESAPNAALVYTLAIGKGGLATDAYSAENQFVADRMAEIESVSARKAGQLCSWFTRARGADLACGRGATTLRNRRSRNHAGWS